MISVTLTFGARKRLWASNHHAVGGLLDARAQPAKAVDGGADAVGFLDAQLASVSYGGRPPGEAGREGQGREARR